MSQRQGESQDDRNRRAVEEMVRDNIETAHRMGNTRVTEEEVRRYVGKIAEEADRKPDHEKR